MIEIKINIHGTTEPEHECFATLTLNGESNWVAPRSYGGVLSGVGRTGTWQHKLEGDLTVTCPHGRSQHIKFPEALDKYTTNC